MNYCVSILKVLCVGKEEWSSDPEFLCKYSVILNFNRNFHFLTLSICFPVSTRHFLFKTSSGTTPLFSSSSPGYPLTSGTVYSPPPRLLPRNTFSRSAFKLKKPSKYCSWKCAAVTAIAAAALLAILLSYIIGKLVCSLLLF